MADIIGVRHPYYSGIHHRAGDAPMGKGGHPLGRHNAHRVFKMHESCNLLLFYYDIDQLIKK